MSRDSIVPSFKFHFLKILGYILENEEVAETHAADDFISPLSVAE